MSLDSGRRFHASYDSTTRFLTAAIIVLLLGVLGATRSIAALALGVVLIFGSYAWSPRAYSVAGRSVVIHRLAGPARFPLDDLREARPAAPGDFNGSIRLFGNGGLFGYYGLFRTAKLGKCTWYVTNRANSVVIVTGAKTAIVSPDDVQEFLSAIRRDGA
jgi:hypothetical protein